MNCIELNHFLLDRWDTNDPDSPYPDMMDLHKNVLTLNGTTIGIHRSVGRVIEGHTYTEALWSSVFFTTDPLTGNMLTIKAPVELNKHHHLKSINIYIISYYVQCANLIRFCICDEECLLVLMDQYSIKKEWIITEIGS